MSAATPARHWALRINWLAEYSTLLAARWLLRIDIRISSSNNRCRANYPAPVAASLFSLEFSVRFCGLRAPQHHIAPGIAQAPPGSENRLRTARRALTRQKGLIFTISLPVPLKRLGPSYSGPLDDVVQGDDAGYTQPEILLDLLHRRELARASLATVKTNQNADTTRTSVI